jgi:transmembrane sensor
LPDGSIVQLNTRSRVALDFSGTARRVRLLDGEALFSVEHDASWPFYVLTDTTTIRAVGTQFNVYRHADSGETTVSVVDGVVQVSPAAMKESTRVAAGESAQIERGGKLVHHEHTPIADAVAWRERRLVFQDASLSEVAAEFNRYNTVQIRTVGTVGETRHIAGIFSADHPQSLILHLKRDPMLEVSEVDGSFIVSAR